MNTSDNKEWRTIQVAAMILYRCFKSNKIEKSNTPLYDLLVSVDDGTGLRFGVNVKSSSYKSNLGYDAAISGMYNYNFEAPENRMPVILMCVNEQAETATFGFLIGWRYGQPRIYRNFEMKQLTLENAQKSIPVIKAMDEVIRVLDEKDFNVLKRIDITENQPDGCQKHGAIFYLRKLTTEYCMSQKVIVDEKEKFNRLLPDIPEEEYPSDTLDNAIRTGVCNMFPNAEFSNRLILLSTDLKDLMLLNRNKRFSTNILVSPDLSCLDMGVAQYLKGMEVPAIPVEIYSEYAIVPDSFENLVFEVSYPLQEWINISGEIKKLLPTIKPLSEYLMLNE